MKTKFIVVFLLLLCTEKYSLLNAQILNPKKLLERKIIDRTNSAINKKTDEALDSMTGKKGQPNTKTDSAKLQKTTTASDTTITTTGNNRPMLETYSKFDFIPGEKVIFYDDFSKDNIGDFPAQWNTNGSAEIVTANLFPGRWMKFSSRNSVWTDQLLNLPDNYTIEFDIIPISGEEGPRMAGYDFRLIKSINAKAFDAGTVPGKSGFLFTVGYTGRPAYRTYMNEPEGQALGLSGYKDDNQFYQKINELYHISIWVQKARVRLYQNENKLFDLPRAFPLPNIKMDRLRFEYGAGMIGNVRVAVGNPDMRSKLITEGKLVSYGIYFDVNSDKVKPESYGTLKGIADVLNENPEVSIKIVGHTDADGNDASNLDLSKRRAASVKNELTVTFGISAGRMGTDGKGESQPIAPNDNPSNKALNRRVEFIKQ